MLFDNATEAEIEEHMGKPQPERWDEVRLLYIFFYFD